MSITPVNTVMGIPRQQRSSERSKINLKRFTIEKLREKLERKETELQELQEFNGLEELYAREHDAMRRSLCILPLDALGEIVKFLPKEDIQKMSLICRRFNYVVVNTTWIYQFHMISAFTEFLLNKIQKIEKKKKIKIITDEQRNIFDSICKEDSPLEAHIAVDTVKNLLKTRTSILKIRNVIIDILKTIADRHLSILDKSVANMSKPNFFEEIFLLIQILKRMELVIDLDDADGRDDIFREISVQLFEIDEHDYAIQAIGLIEDRTYREMALSDFAKNLAELNRFALARQLVADITIDWRKRVTLEFISDCEEKYKNTKS